ncbi:MAG: glycosyltransferase [Deltaproteobacteria bacterium]|nr:MAG: glycosyltransferase [Deltaproteobacteria bacterium]
MEVLHINTERGWGGGEQQLLYLTEGLEGRDCHCTVLCQPEVPLAKRSRERELKTIELKMRGEWDLWAALRIAQLLKERKYDLVHLHTSHAHTLGLLARLRGWRGKGVVSRRVTFRLRKGPINKLKYRYFTYICISQAVRDVLIADGVAPEKINVVYSGIDLGRFESGGTVNIRRELGIPEGKIIGNIGHIAGHKGQRDLIEATPQILRVFPDASILIIGEGKLRRNLERLAEDLGVKNRVIFMGFRNDIPSLLRSMDIFVYPSHWEGLGTSLLDAMAAEVPVVATNTGGIPEVISDRVNGMLVSPRGPKALAKAVLTILQNDDLAKKLARAGRGTVKEKFTVDRMVEGTLEVYRKVMAN